MENKNKGKKETSDGASRNSADATRDAHQAKRDLSHEREATLNRKIAEAITRETAKVNALFEAILNDKSTLSLAGSDLWSSRL